MFLLPVSGDAPSGPYSVRTRTCQKVVAPSQTVKAHVLPIPEMREGEFGSGNFVGGEVHCAASALPAGQLHRLLQSACLAAMSSETSTFAFFKQMNRCYCLSDAPSLFSEHVYKLNFFLLFKMYH